MSESDDDMASLHVSNILKKAVNTFTSKSDLFKTNLEQLANIFNTITSRHVNLNPMFMNESTWAPKNKAPMTYVHIFNDNIINVGIFILKPNTKLPLHNHPEMFGLLKVIAGTVNITSYSLNTEKTKKYDMKNNGDPTRIIAEKMDDVLANSETNCCILEPDAGNIHEIESVNGAAAFIDILSPPYDVEIPDVGERKCTYFNVEQEVESGIYELREINTPNWFWSDTFPYTGPKFKDL